MPESGRSPEPCRADATSEKIAAERPKEGIVAVYIRTEEGRRKLAAAMAHPLRRRKLIVTR